MKPSMSMSTLSSSCFSFSSFCSCWLCPPNSGISAASLASGFFVASLTKAASVPLLADVRDEGLHALLRANLLREVFEAWQQPFDVVATIHILCVLQRQCFGGIRGGFLQSRDLDLELCCLLGGLLLQGVFLLDLLLEFLDLVLCILLRLDLLRQLLLEPLMLCPLRLRLEF